MDVTPEGSERCLHRQVGREETDHVAGHRRSELCARLTDEFAEAEPVARIASVRSPSYAACSMSASESLSGTATDEAAAEAADRIGPVLRRQIS